jgi:hypothetical protein
MRRFLTALAVAGILWAAAPGSAATLDVSGGALAVGGASVGACDHDGVHVRLALAWREHPVLGSITVRGIADACIGRSMSVVLVVAGAPVELAPTRILPRRHDDNEVRLRVPGSVPAIDLDGIHMAIS